MNTVTTKEDLISTPEFAGIVGIVRATLQRYIEEGKVPYEGVVRYPDGKRRRYTLSRQLAEDIRDKGWQEAVAAYNERREHER